MALLGLSYVSMCFSLVFPSFFRPSVRPGISLFLGLGGLNIRKHKVKYGFSKLFSSVRPSVRPGWSGGTGLSVGVGTPL